MTETGMITSNPYDGERRPGTVGMPLPGVELRIVDPETGAALPDGEIGVIEVRGPNVFSGYWRNPEKTAEEFRDDGFFITGDLARIDTDGYVNIVGRDKDLIISGGFNVYPAEVEAVLDACPGIAESAVIGLPHPDFGEGVTAIVAAKSDAQIEAASYRRVASFVLPAAAWWDEYYEPMQHRIKVLKARLSHDPVAAGVVGTDRRPGASSRVPGRWREKRRHCGLFGFAPEFETGPSAQYHRPG